MREGDANEQIFRRRSLPPAGSKVEVLCRHDGAIRPLPFLCVWSDDGGWVIAGSRRKLMAEVLGWRYR